jgi:uncharacterized protein YaeQ
MAYRFDLHLNGGHRKLVLAARPEETLEHIALRLSAFLLFWEEDPKMELSPKHPALAGQEFRPDLIALASDGGIRLWGECGNVSLNKLDKLTRRCPGARIVVLKSSEADGRRMRRDLEEGIDRPASVLVRAWPQEAFKPWMRALHEATLVVGECAETSLNLVINDVPLAVDFLSF